MKLTPKENMLRCMKGEVPEWVPIFTMGMTRNGCDTAADTMMFPGLMKQKKLPNGHSIDIWGVEHVPTESAGGAAIPKTHDFILDDIRKWRDVIKAPSLEGIDWEKMYNDDLKERNIDRSKLLVALGSHVGYFQTLMAFMGFTEGLMAMYEEPEEVKALFEYLNNFYCTVLENYAPYCKPDFWNMADDTAAWANPFISADMYREYLLPMYEKQSRLGREWGIPISMHNCGKCEGIIDDLVGIGLTLWEPAQTCNDLVAVKKRHGNKLVICGGWDARDRLLEPDVTYEEIHASVKKSFDMLAEGGGYIFMGGFLGYTGDENIKHKNEMLTKAYVDLSTKYY